MARHVVLLRGVNLGSRNRIAMPELRRLLEEAGFDDVATYLQSGNVVLSSRKAAGTVARECKKLIADRLGLEIDVLARTQKEVADVVERDPLARVAKNPKRYQVTFLAAKPKGEVVRRLEEAAVGGERVVAVGREIYAWHPDGIARSKLWALIAGPTLGVGATSRNWTTVTKLLELVRTTR
jgi:uncharacterized protein (DUF1697 family)